MNCLEENSDELVDITAEFKDACKLALFPGELLHGSWFSLQYAIFAIEIMDPKLDSRCQNRRKVPTLTQAITSNMLKFSRFEEKAVLLGIIDELLCSFVNWLNGDPLMQTIFSSMYMHCTQLIEDEYLTLFCESMRKVVYYMREIIISASIYEEEDFYASLNGISLQAPEKRFDDFNEKAEQFNKKFRPNSTEIEYSLLIDELKRICEQLDGGSEDWQYNLSIRFRFIRDLLFISQNIHQLCQENKVLSMMSNLYIDDGSSCESINITKLLENCDSVTNDLIANSHELLVTSDVGIQPDKGKEDPRNYEYGIPGFEPLLNSLKQPASIPRSVKIIGRTDGFIYLTELAQRLRNVVFLFSRYLKNTKSPHLSLASFYIIMQKLGQIEARQMKKILNDSEKSPRLQIAGGCIFSRSFCQLLSNTFLKENSRIASNQCVETLMRAWSKMDPFIDEKFFDQVLEKQFVPEILSQCENSIKNIIMLFCNNTSRQYTAAKILFRDYMVNSSYWYHLENSLIPLFEEDELAKELLKDQRPNFSFIMIYYFYHLVWNYLTQGFYMELYSCSELPIVYSFLISHLKNLDKLIESYLFESGLTHFKFRAKKEKIPNFEKMQENYYSVTSRLSNELNYIRGNLFLIGGSLMAHLAILKDCNLDLDSEPVEVKEKSIASKVRLNLPKSNYKEIFSRRFGILLENPLLFPKEHCGRENVCNYLIEKNKEIFKNKESSEIYANAAKLFNTARDVLEKYKMNEASLDQDVEKETMLKIYPHPTQMDTIEDLIVVAKRNLIASNVLSACPDKRPTKTSIKPASSYFPYKNSPVTMDLNVLTSKSIPVIMIKTPKKS